MVTTSKGGMSSEETAKQLPEWALKIREARKACGPTQLVSQRNSEGPGQRLRVGKRMPVNPARRSSKHLVDLLRKSARVCRHTSMGRRAPAK